MGAQRTYRNLTVTFDGLPLSMPLAAVPQRVPGARGDLEFKYACPDCETAEPVAQQYRCTRDDHHGPFMEGQLQRRRVLADGSYAKVTENEVFMAKTGGVTANQLVLRAHPAAQVEAATRPGEGGYRLRPPSGKGKGLPPTKPYGILLGLASNPEVALVGEVNMNDTVKLYRVGVHRGQLLMTELIRPDELADTDEIPLEDVSAAELERAAALAGEIVTDFDAEAYRNLTRERVLELAAAKEAAGLGTPVTEAEVPVKTADVADILSLIEKSITDRKGAPAPIPTEAIAS